MHKITEEELLLICSTLNKASGAGYNGITPGLLKIITTTTWSEKVPCTEGEAQAYRLHDEFYDYMREAKSSGATVEAVRREPRGKDTEITYEPKQSRQFLLCILNLCLEIRDLPDSEKLGIITALPKSEGMVTSMDDIRPITVGPALSRLLHKILAHRLGSLISGNGDAKKSLIDPAQFAFMAGYDIHEPINSAVACYRDFADRLTTENPVGCFATYYDISKAYDTIRWDSIKKALENLGIDENFITFVMSSLKGTRVAMRTNVPGNITRKVTLHKSIKQGCPLAPLLFIIVMDEMHKELRKLGLGYKLANGDRISSRGYCDDTYIVANSAHDLNRMNDEVIAPFFEKHGLQINETKTKVTGRYASGAPYQDTMVWPGSGKPFETIPPSDSVRYLGAHINLDLDWTTQINKMQASVMTTAAHARSKRLTAFQCIAITRHVIASRLEIGMRHAHIPAKTLQMWDDTIASAISQRCGLTKLHKTSTAATLMCSNICTFSNQYMLTKIAHTMEMVTKRAELNDHYITSIEPIIKAIDQAMGTAKASVPSEKEIKQHLKEKGVTQWPTMAKDLIRIAAHGIFIRKTKKSAGLFERAPRKNPINLSDYKRPASNGPNDTISGGTATFDDIEIPWQVTHDLWGAAFDKAAALLPLLAKPSPPSSVVEALNAQTKVQGTKYHHPACRKNATSRMRHCTLAEALQANCKRSDCNDCAQHWESLDSMANNYVRAVICTDGSTHNGRPSAAALHLPWMASGAKTSGKRQPHAGSCRCPTTTWLRWLHSTKRYVQSR